MAVDAPWGDKSQHPARVGPPTAMRCHVQCARSLVRGDRGLSDGRSVEWRPVATWQREDRRYMFVGSVADPIAEVRIAVSQSGHELGASAR